MIDIPIIPKEVVSLVKLRVTELRIRPTKLAFYELIGGNGKVSETSNVILTDQQWANWPKSDDDFYAERCVAANLELVIDDAALAVAVAEEAARANNATVSDHDIP